jgi:site-specific DNA recombinase
VREDEVLPELDAWLAGQFAPDRIEEVIEDVTAAQDSTGHQQMITEAHQAIRECETKMARYRAALDVGGDVEEITSWINAAKAERLRAEATICSAAAPARLSRQEITTVVEYCDADPTDKADIYCGLKLVLTYQPAAQTVRA